MFDEVEFSPVWSRHVLPVYIQPHVSIFLLLAGLNNATQTIVRADSQNICCQNDWEISEAEQVAPKISKVFASV